jgi:hypothetical protein
MARPGAFTTLARVVPTVNPRVVVTMDRKAMVNRNLILFSFSCNDQKSYLKVVDALECMDVLDAGLFY